MRRARKVEVSRFLSVSSAMILPVSARISSSVGQAFFAFHLPKGRKRRRNLEKEPFIAILKQAAVAHSAQHEAPAQPWKAAFRPRECK